MAKACITEEAITTSRAAVRFLYAGYFSVSYYLVANSYAMKRSLLTGFCLFLIGPAMAQIPDSLLNRPKYPNHIRQGDLSASLFLIMVNKSPIQHTPYNTVGAEAAAVFYPFNRLGLETGLAIHHYYFPTYEISPTPATNLDFDKTNQAVVSQRLRYHFVDQPDFASFYLQTGYNWGRFWQENVKKIEGWEIASLGMQMSLIAPEPRKVASDSRKGCMELLVGLQKDNLHDKPVWFGKMGFTFYLGKPSNVIQ